MKNITLRIATRKSPLALWQAEFVKQALLKAHPNFTIELVGITTAGDKNLKTSLNKIGGKGLFVKELEQALLENKADIAVHSMKDVPMEFPSGLCLTAICEREDPRDVLVSNLHYTIEQLPKGAVIGTSSLRRQCQILARRPDLQVKTLRGNVDTRLNKLDSGEFTAIILAAAGLKRLGLTERITSYLPIEQCLPAIGQGAIGIECRETDPTIKELLTVLNHKATFDCVMAERVLSHELGASCQVPVGGYATIIDTQITLRGLVGKPNGSQILYGEKQGHVQTAQSLGLLLAQELIAKGAGQILQEL